MQPHHKYKQVEEDLQVACVNSFRGEHPSTASCLLSAGPSLITVASTHSISSLAAHNHSKLVAHQRQEHMHDGALGRHEAYDTRPYVSRYDGHEGHDGHDVRDALSHSDPFKTLAHYDGYAQSSGNVWPTEPQNDSQKYSTPLSTISELRKQESPATVSVPSPVNGGPRVKKKLPLNMDSLPAMLSTKDFAATAADVSGVPIWSPSITTCMFAI